MDQYELFEKPLSPKPGNQAKSIKNYKHIWLPLFVIILTAAISGGAAGLYVKATSITPPKMQTQPWNESQGKKIQDKDNFQTMKEYANEYSKSVAFVLVEYWLKKGEEIVYRNHDEGTAFLVDKEGYLLTNRHVACPWLEDFSIRYTAGKLERTGKNPDFGYRIFLWFEGEKAFNRPAEVMDTQDLSDFYFLESAFRTDGIPQVTIEGVAQFPDATPQNRPPLLKDDFAILKIDDVPEELKPFPMSSINPMDIPKLTRLITIGFPLGSWEHGEKVNASVVMGHVRRSFEDLIQVDTSFHSGSSGSPLIDINGEVVGIASGVAISQDLGILTPSAPLWDMALVLPISKARTMLQDLKAGRLEWTNIFDLDLGRRNRNIAQTASPGRWYQNISIPSPYSIPVIKLY